MCQPLEGIQTCNHVSDGSMFMGIKWGNVLISYTNDIFSVTISSVICLISQIKFNGEQNE